MSRHLMQIAIAAALPFLAAAATAAAPDFSGVWERYPDPYAELANSRFAEDPPPPGAGPPLKEPYASEYRKGIERREVALKEGKPLSDPSTQCKPEGMPTIMGAIYPLEILQTPSQIVVLAEFLTQTRRIYLNEQLPPLEDVSPSYNGHSVGRWEGQTLVVETIGVREDVQFVGAPHSPQMKVTERLRLTAPDRLEIQITIDDPAFLAKPYKFTFGYKRNPGYRIMEYICDSNHYRTNEDGSLSLEIAPKK